VERQEKAIEKKERTMHHLLQRKKSPRALGQSPYDKNMEN